MAARVIPISGARTAATPRPDNEVRQAFCAIVDILQVLAYERPAVVKSIARFLAGFTRHQR